MNIFEVIIVLAFLAFPVAFLGIIFIGLIKVTLYGLFYGMIYGTFWSLWFKTFDAIEKSGQSEDSNNRPNESRRK